MKKYSLYLAAIFLLLCAGYISAQEEPGYTLSGRVTEEDLAVENARVVINGMESVRTDGNGEYTIEVFAGEITVKAITPEGLMEEKKITIEKEGAEKNVELDFQFQSVLLRGRVMEGEYPLEGARIHISGNPVITTGVDGGFEKKLQTGEYRIFAVTQQGEFIGEEFINVSRDQENEIGFLFTPGNIEISVLKEEKGVSGIKIILGRNSPAKTDANGNCRLKAAPGATIIYLRDQQGKLLGEREVKVTAGTALKEIFIVK